MTIESHVQLNVEGTGPEIRTLEVGTYEPASDGAPVPATVHQQVVVLADKLGRILENDGAWREEVLAELRKTNEWLEIIAETVQPG